MNPDRQRIAIAEACGWTFINDMCGINTGYPPNEIKRVPVPKYTNDRNAIIDAISEVVCGISDWEKAFLVRLNEILEARADDDAGQLIYMTQLAMITVSANELCDCFLHAIGKWEGGDE